MEMSQKTRDILAKVQSLRKNKTSHSIAEGKQISANAQAFAYAEKIRKSVYYKQLQTVSQLFETRNIQFIVLKGFALLDQLYDQTPERLSGDIDILVKFCDLQKACSVLIEGGYVNEEWKTNVSEGLVTDSHLLMGMNHLREFIIENENTIFSLLSPFHLELHYAIASTYPVDIGDDCIKYNLNQLDLFSNARRQSKDGLKFDLLDYNHEFLALLYHFSIHAMHSFRKVIRTDAEIALYWTHNSDNLDMDSIWNEAIDCRRGYAVYLPLRIVNAAFNLDIPMRSYHEANRVATGQDTTRKNVQQLADIPPHIWFMSQQLKWEFMNHIRDKIFEESKKRQFVAIHSNCQVSIHINRLKGLRYDQHISDSSKETCNVLNTGDSKIEIIFSGNDISDVESEYSEIKEATRKDIGKPGIYIMCISKRLHSEKYLPLIWGYNIYKEHDRWHIVSTNHGGEDVEYIIKTNGKELHFIISDNMFENAIDLHMAAYKSAFQPYYHIIG